MDYLFEKIHLIKNTLLNGIHQGVYSFFIITIKPKSFDEDMRRRELILNILLVGTMIMLGIYLILVIIHSLQAGDTHQGLSISFFGIITALFYSLLFFSRKGFITGASFGLITLYFMGATYGAFHFSADVAQIILTFALVIIISSILVGTRYGFLITVMSAIVLATSWHMQLTSGILPLQSWRMEFRETDSLEYIVMLFLIMIVSWLSNREIERSLHRARTSEAELIQERNLLELRIEERTSELKKLQMDQIGELSRHAELGNLSSGIFHDLMNPLTAVIANVDQMESGKGDLHQLKTYLERAVTASKRMGHYLTTIRRQIKPSQDLVSFSANKEIEEAVDMLHYTSRLNNVSLMMTHNDPVILFGNPLKFHRIALNLIANAIESYTEAVDTSERVVEISTTKKEGSVIFTVKDFGCGMDDVLKKRIFEPFFTTKQGKGSGIGLATTQAIARDDFNTSISVESLPGKGSLFSIVFPITQ